MKALICGLLKYPDGDGGAIRQEKLAKMMQKLGYDVLVIGMGKSTDEKVFYLDGIAFTSFKRANDDKISKVLSHLQYWAKLKNVMEHYQPDVVIMDDLGPIKTLRLKGYCKRNQIKLIHDSVEWYSPEQFARGKCSAGYIKKDLLNRYLIDKQCSVIAISSYLQKHFSNKGIACVNIPIVVTSNDLCQEKHLHKDVVTFTYAGQPGKKDYLHIILESFAQLDENELYKVRINIVGCDEEQILLNGTAPEILEKVKCHTVYHGRVPHQRVLELLKETDFTVLMRSSYQRYAKAGFPTKMVESLSRSTPMICNLTSDMGQYLVDGYNALLVKDCDSKQLVETIRRALSTCLDQRMEMSNNAWKTAAEYFLCEKYLPVLKQLLS